MAGVGQEPTFIAIHNYLIFLLPGAKTIIDLATT
jgi:hypothetical protein